MSSGDDPIEHACDLCGVNVENGDGRYFEDDRLCGWCFDVARQPDDPYAQVEYRARAEGLDAAELMGGREVRVRE